MLLRAERRLLAFSGSDRKFGELGVGIWTANFDFLIAGVRLVEGPGSENRIRFLDFVGVEGACSLLEGWPGWSASSVGLLLVRLLRFVAMALLSKVFSRASTSAMVKDFHRVEDMLGHNRDESRLYRATRPMSKSEEGGILLPCLCWVCFEKTSGIV